jgi:FkbM family methyltransferase
MRIGVSSILSKYRRNIWVRKLDSVLIKWHKAYENLDYNFHRNGEADLLKKLKTIQLTSSIFDVGANKGLWSLMVSEFFPQSTIYAFEIVPDTYAHLVTACGQQKNIVTHNIGLSDAEGATTVYYSAEQSGLATCLAGFTENFHKYRPMKVEASVTTGDIFCSDNGVQAIDFLKIDVEGYEHKVIKGFEGMLKKGLIKIIQFEYGYVNVHTHFLLKDFHDYLGAFDMKIGKVYPSYVDFREYQYVDENFYGPNYLAVHLSCADIIDTLSN